MYITVYSSLIMDSPIDFLKNFLLFKQFQSKLDGDALQEIFAYFILDPYCVALFSQLEHLTLFALTNGQE